MESKPRNDELKQAFGNLKDSIKNLFEVVDKEIRTALFKTSTYSGIVKVYSNGSSRSRIETLDGEVLKEYGYNYIDDINQTHWKLRRCIDIDSYKAIVSNNVLLISKPNGKFDIIDKEFYKSDIQLVLEMGVGIITIGLFLIFIYSYLMPMIIESILRFR